MASQCQRSILSCARCRRRKIKCDRQLPTCSQCISAKTTCTGIAAKVNTSDVAANPDGPAVIPRSIVQHLESEIARLETALLRDGQLEVVHASDILLGMPGTTGTTVPAEDRQDTQTTRNESAANHNVIDPALHQSTQSTSPELDIQSFAPSPFAARRAAIVGSCSLQAVISATLPYENGAAAGLLSKVRMGLTPSTAKVRERSSGSTSAARSSTAARSKAAATATSANTHGTVNRTAVVSTSPGQNGQQQLQAPVLRSIPWDIVQRLLRKYLNTIQPDNPFLVVSTVMQQFRNVADVLGKQRQISSDPSVSVTATGPIPPSHDFLVVYLILAISVMLGSANDGHEERCAALSVSLFDEGIQHLYGLPIFPSELAWLQTILLVLLYATVFPRAANVWVLSGVAMRSCLELGLHREQPPSSLLGLARDISSEDADLRRRVFWAAYCMDRSICSALQRPLSTPDTAIDTLLPWSTAAPSASSRADPFLRSVEYSRLLSEMLHVHFHREPIPPPLDWDGWLVRMEGRLQSWCDSASSIPDTCFESNNLMLARGLMVLHRPSPRVPFPAPSSLLRAFEAAAAAERLHYDHLRTGVFRRTWLSAHYTLEAATVVLFCLRHGYDAIAERFTPAQIFDRAKLITSNLLAIAAHSWPEVSIYAGVYERLLGPLLERVFLRMPLLDTNRFGPAEDAELMRLLYPGPAHLDSLRFGLHQKQPQPSPRADLAPFDFNLFMIDDDIWDQAGLLTRSSAEDNWTSLQDMDFGM